MQDLPAARPSRATSVIKRGFEQGSEEQVGSMEQLAGSIEHALLFFVEAVRAVSLL